MRLTAAAIPAIRTPTDVWTCAPTGAPMWARGLAVHRDGGGAGGRLEIRDLELLE